jgi:cell division protein FtsZ
LSGPKDISFAEAQVAMQELERLAGGDHDIQMSVHAQEVEGAPLKVFLLAIIGGNVSATTKGESPSKIESLLHKKEVSSPAARMSLERPPVPKPAVSMVTNLPREEEKKPSNQTIKELFPEAAYKNPEESDDFPATKLSISSKTKPTQGALNLKTIQRGRFDKSEPTIVEGEDLDTPTYLRLGLKLS